MDASQIESKPTRSLWRISASLMISFLSMFAMIFIDRLYLTKHSPDALAAASSAGTLCWATNLGWITLAGMAEIFVAQYNGARRFDKLGKPVWQMIWLSLISTLFFIPIGTMGAQFLLEADILSYHETTYFRWNILFAPALTLLSALSAFYIGQGKTAIITWMALLGNTVNVMLDPLLIFGIEGLIPAYGIKGAAVATGAGIIIQVVILFWAMTSQKNREVYGTANYKFNSEMFWRCVKVGLPPAAFITFDLLGWALFYWMMTQLGKEYILVASICQSILYLFLFFGLGLEKGAAALAGNLIGAGKPLSVHKVVISGTKLTLLFALCLSIFLIAMPDLLLNWFLGHKPILTSLGITDATSLANLISTIKSALVLITAYLAIESFRWMLDGVLTAAGDTFFLMVSGAASVWLFMLVPTYILVFKQGAPILTAFNIWLVYSTLATLITLARYFQGKWQEGVLIEREASDKIAS